MKKKKRCYLAGPMTGVPEFNRPLFMRADKHLSEDGWLVSNPFNEFNGDTSLAWTTYLNRDLELVSEAEAIVLLPGWQDVGAVGMRVELVVAIARGKEVYEYVPVDSGFRLAQWYGFDPRKAVGAIMQGKSPGGGQVHDEPKDILQKARGLINGARQQDYDHPLDNFGRIVRLWNALLHDKLKEPITEEEHALMMQQVKQARLLHSPAHEDSIIDIAGYAGTYEMVANERVRRAAS